MTRAFLSLGSNLGDRPWYLKAALDALDYGSLLTARGVSKIYETSPVEVEEDQPEYLNCVAEVEYRASALELLRFCEGVEAALGRDRKGDRKPRTLDLDLLLFGDEILDEPYLRVPHPGVVRAFNLKGLADLDPRLTVPGHGVVEDLLFGADLSGVREFEGAESC